MLHTKEVLNTYLSAFCTQPIEKLRRDTDRDFYMTPFEAKDYGIIDEVIQHKLMLPTPKIPSLHVSIAVFVVLPSFLGVYIAVALWSARKHHSFQCCCVLITFLFFCIHPFRYLRRVLSLTWAALHTNRTLPRLAMLSIITTGRRKDGDKQRLLIILILV